MSSASSIAILLLLIGAVILQWESIILLIGTGGLVAIVIFLVISLVIGYFAGGSDPVTRRVMGLRTARRNLSVALVVGAQNLSDSPNVLITVVVAALIGLAMLRAEPMRNIGTQQSPTRDHHSGFPRDNTMTVGARDRLKTRRIES